MSPLTVVMVGVDGLAAGALLINWVGLARAMDLIGDPGEYVRFHQATNRTFDPFMPLLMAAAATISAVSAVVSDAERAVAFSIASSATFLGVIVFSLSTSVRLNKAIDAWSADDPPPSWSRTRTKWIKLHVMRTAFALCGFGFGLVAAAPAA